MQNKSRGFWDKKKVFRKKTPKSLAVSKKLTTFAPAKPTDGAARAVKLA
jgi:hypothetical protein